MDSLNHVQTSVSVRRSIIQGISVHSIYIRERCSFSLVCTFNKAIKNFEVKKIIIQMGVLRFRKNKYDSFISFIIGVFIYCYHMVIVYSC